MSKDEKIYLIMEYDEDTETLHIIDSTRGYPKNVSQDKVVASVDDVLKIKSTLLVLETTKVPPIIKTILRKGSSSDTAF